MQQIQRVYLSPKLWYLRVRIIEARNIMPGHRGLEVVRFPEFSTKVKVGNQIWRTGNAAPSATRSFSDPCWNMEHMFVVTEAFEDNLLVSIVDQVESGREQVVATMLLSLATIKKQTDEKSVTSGWFKIESHFGNAGDNDKLNSWLDSQIRLQISFDDGYDVLDEGIIHSSDVRNTDKRLWKSQVGVLEMTIMGAAGLAEMKTREGRGVTDAYCVAKYGREWVQTHTVVDSLSPQWNERYKWEVYDPCSVFTIGVFDDGGINKNTTSNPIARDCPLGKVKIRLSTIETDRVYSHSYPLLMLDPSGLREMGELHLVLKFSCTNVANMLLKYTMPLLPKMHYLHPLSAEQLDMLRYKALNVVASKLSNEEPPLRKEVVKYMHDLPELWSMRRSKAIYVRLLSILSGPIAVLKWLEEIRNWRKPLSSILFIIIYVTLVMLPAFIIPIILLYMAFVTLRNYMFRPRHPPHIDTKLSYAEGVLADEVAEEFDSFPTTENDEIVRTRYDRLRHLAGKVETIMGDVAAHGERFQDLLSYKDTRATSLFILFLLAVYVAIYFVPLRVVVVLLGLYSLRPPNFRNKLPCPLVCFFKRFSGKVDNTFLTTEGKAYVCQDTQTVLVVGILESLQQPT